MITPLQIIKASWENYQKHWKTIFLYTGLATFSSCLIFIIYFIRLSSPNENLGLSIFFIILLPILALNVIFLYINLLHFLYKNQAERQINKLFTNFQWRQIGRLLVLFALFLGIFSVCFTFPLLVLNSLASVFQSAVLNWITLVISIVLMLLGIVIFNYLQFTYALAILKENDNIKTILVKSYLLIKKRWWSALINQSIIMLTISVISVGLFYLFISLYPSAKIILISNGQLSISTIFLVLFFLTYTLTIFITLNLGTVYNLNFFKIYEKTAVLKKEPEDKE
ncbi:MAG TPA: hypothetical protein PL066_02275 [bacterium]|nr:hypothetical protein [bacterium]